MGTFSPENIYEVFETKEAKLALQEQKIHGSPYNDRDSYLDHFLKVEYPIFKIENEVYLKISVGTYDLVIDNESPESSANQISRFLANQQK